MTCEQGTVLLRTSLLHQGPSARSPAEHDDALPPSFGQSNLYRFGLDIGLGALAAVVAVAIRAALPLNPQQLPTLPVVVTLAIVTTFVGARAGITCAVLGGLASWYLFFNPRSWSLAGGAWIPLLGFAVIAVVIITTSHLLRNSERRLHRRERAWLAERAANSELFAGELAHRLKNTLTIVQAIALQTLNSDQQTEKFASRLRALAVANDLLSEHMSEPTADLQAIVEAAVVPFDRRRFHLAVSPGRVPAQQVVNLSLCLHELATNAMKYGALSSEKGRVIIETEERDDAFKVSWEEQGGPAPASPKSTGFGTRLIRRAAMNSSFDYNPAGLRCAFELPRV